jgi:hypothetical protein
MFYASVSEGIKSGGFTTYNGSQAAPPLKPEVLWAYETGLKSNLFKDTLQLNASAFYYHYEDEQIQSAVWSTTGPVGSLVNAPKSHVYGGELEAIWAPIDNLKFSEAVGWKDGKFDVFPNFLNIAATEAKCPSPNFALCAPPLGTPVNSNEKGARLGFPPLSYNGSLSYFWELFTRLHIHGRGRLGVPRSPEPAAAGPDVLRPFLLAGGHQSLALAGQRTVAGHRLLPQLHQQQLRHDSQLLPAGTEHRAARRTRDGRCAARLQVLILRGGSGSTLPPFLRH